MRWPLTRDTDWCGDNGKWTDPSNVAESVFVSSLDYGGASSCSECHYWLETEQNEERGVFGQCRRYAPRLIDAPGYLEVYIGNANEIG